MYLSIVCFVDARLPYTHAQLTSGVTMAGLSDGPLRPPDSPTTDCSSLSPPPDELPSPEQPQDSPLTPEGSPLTPEQPQDSPPTPEQPQDSPPTPEQPQDSPPTPEQPQDSPLTPDPLTPDPPTPTSHPPAMAGENPDPTQPLHDATTDGVSFSPLPDGVPTSSETPEASPPPRDHLNSLIERFQRGPSPVDAAMLLSPVSSTANYYMHPQSVRDLLAQVDRREDVPGTPEFLLRHLYAVTHKFNDKFINRAKNGNVFTRSAFLEIKENVASEWMHGFAQNLIFDKVAFALSKCPAEDDRPLQSPSMGSLGIHKSLKKVFDRYEDWRTTLKEFKEVMEHTWRYNDNQYIFPWSKGNAISDWVRAGFIEGADSMDVVKPLVESDYSSQLMPSLLKDVPTQTPPQPDSGNDEMDIDADSQAHAASGNNDGTPSPARPECDGPGQIDKVSRSLIQALNKTWGSARASMVFTNFCYAALGLRGLMLRGEQIRSEKGSMKKLYDLLNSNSKDTGDIVKKKTVGDFQLLRPLYVMSMISPITLLGGSVVSSSHERIPLFALAQTATARGLKRDRTRMRIEYMLSRLVIGMTLYGAKVYEAGISAILGECDSLWNEESTSAPGAQAYIQEQSPPPSRASSHPAPGISPVVPEHPPASDDGLSDGGSNEDAEFENSRALVRDTKVTPKEWERMLKETTDETTYLHRRLLSAIRQTLVDDMKGVNLLGDGSAMVDGVLRDAYSQVQNNSGKPYRLKPIKLASWSRIPVGAPLEPSSKRMADNDGDDNSRPSKRIRTGEESSKATSR
ncbi:hypothetical protein A7U60_g2458 [Sanghuangporus baumii]|uniref:Uncharacterized protein n=1 Tax=Sanghuangporus baumii TaxID=108892 RepID=A0A9Q5I2L5_SANBA|nr:hypothetical protein A7U60_g2458 [Sanghuangporus baumii]